MEYETVKHKEKKISVKISGGSIWDELKENLRGKKCYDAKKTDKKKLLVDVNVKREFRSNLKDDSWVNRIKSALGRSKCQDQSCSDKKDSSGNKQKKDTNKAKPCEKKVKEANKCQEPENVVTFVKEQSQNIVSQTKQRLSGLAKDSNNALKSKKGTKPLDEDPKDKHKNKEPQKNDAAAGDANKDKERPPEYALKSSRQKGNKYEVQINHNVVVMNPEDFDEDLKETEERVKRRQIIKDKRSKSKPGTAKEKWTESIQGKKLDMTTEPTLETIKNLKSSIISLRVVDAKVKKETDQNVKPKEHKTVRDEEKKRKRKTDEDKKSVNEPEGLGPELSKAQLKESQGTDRRKRHGNEDIMRKVDKALMKENAVEHRHGKNQNNCKKRKEKDKIGPSEGLTEEAATTDVDRAATPPTKTDDKAINTCEEETYRNSSALLDDRPSMYSSSCYGGSSSSDDQDCSCGCMESTHKICRNKSESSPSSSSSVEYLRSYSGNLIMCAHGKKPVLSQHIRYLTSCVKL